MSVASFFNWDNNLQANMNLETSFFDQETPGLEELLVAPDYNHQPLPPYSSNQLDPNMSYVVDPYSSNNNFVHPLQLVPSNDPIMYDNQYDSNYDNLVPCQKRKKCMYDENHYDNLVPCPKRKKCTYDENHYDYDGHDNLVPCPKRKKCMYDENHYDYGYDNLVPCPKRKKCMHDENRYGCGYENLLLSCSKRKRCVLYDENHYDHCENLVPCPKRHKFMSYENNLVSSNDMTAPINNNLLFDWNNIVVPNNIPKFYNNNGVAGNVESAAAAAVEEGGRKEEKEAAVGPTVVSVQSVAARERRKKIADKTQELGKLVPGGSKMNTAEMLHAAAKYVNYLKAQLSMLQLMDKLKQEDEVAFTGIEEIKKLLNCPVIEEKIYMEEKCFVPKEYLTKLTTHKDIISKPSILKDLNQFISADTETGEQ